MRRLISQNEIPFKFCLFIDGLDEYEGDETEIAELFAQLSSTNRMKCCVSSRPHKPFLDAFCDVPRMRLQDLTYQDIQRYVSDKLEADARMRRLAMARPHDVQDLVNEIVSSASGVFLWIRLVVASLLRGLGNDDEIEDLQARLRVIPKDLESLYKDMILRVDEMYQQESSRMFLLVHTAASARWDESNTVKPLSALTLRYAIEDHKSLASTAPTNFTDMGTITIRSEDTISRLATRCGGLLEAHVNENGPARAEVMFMHRTVKDFLERPDNKTLLEGRATKGRAPRFIPEFAILKAMVLVLKLDNLVPDIGCAFPVFMKDAIIYARRVESLPDLPRDGVNVVMDEFAGTALHRINSWTWAGSGSFRFSRGATAYTIAVDCGFHQYLRYLLQQKNIIRYENRMWGRESLLERAIKARTRDAEHHNARVVEALVEFGADPEKAFRYALSYLDEIRGYDPGEEGRREILDDCRSLLMKVIPLQPRQVTEELSILREFPGDWEEIFRLAGAVQPRKRLKLWRILRFRR